MALSGKNLELAMRIRADLQQAIGELKQLEGAVEASGHQAKTSSDDMDKLGGAIGKVAGSLIAAVAGGAFAAWIKGSIDAAAQLQTFAQVAGTSTTQFQKWAVGARTVGVSSEQLSDILKDVNDKVGDFMQTGAGPMVDFFNGIAPQIGVTADQFRNLSGADALQLYVSSLEKANLSQADMTFYMEAIANDATKLLPLLQNSGAGMAAWADEAERLGLILSEETIVQAKEFNQQLDTIGLLTGNVGSQIAAEMLPTLNEMAGLLIELSQDSELASVAADAFGIVLKGLAIAGIGVGSTLASVGRSIGGLAAAAMAAASGELTQAGEILRQLKADNAAGAAEAEARINRLLNGGYSEAGERAAAANKKIADSQRQATLSAKEYQDQQEAAKKASEEAARAAKKQADDAARAAKQLADQQESYVAGLEKQAATLNLTAAQVRAYELAEKGLTGALRDRAIAAQAVIAAEERKQQLDADAKQIAGLRAQLLRAEGRDAEALTIEIEQRYGELMTRLRERGDTAGLAIIDGLVNVEQAQLNFDEIEKRYNAVLAEQSRQEQSVQAEQQAGLLSEVGARERILEIHRATGDKLRELRPELEQMAQMPGAIGEAAQRVLDNLDANAANLRNTMTLLQETLRSGIEGGLTSALSGLANGTMNLREAVTALGQSVADALAQMAARNIAEGLTNSLMGIGGNAAADAAGATATATAITTATTAGATTMGTGITAGGTTAATAMGAAITSAGASAAAIMASAIASASAASSTGNALSTAASVAAVAASTGGHITGPGTTTSDSIPAWLSDWEFVTRAAVVQQPGALEFLHDFNARGMAALNDYRVHHNTGGLAGVPAPALPSPGMPSGKLAEPAKGMSTNLKNSVNLYAVQRPEDVAGMAWGKAGQEHFLVYLQQNGAEVRQLLGIN